MQFLFRIFGMPCFPRGELVAVTGKAKSGKTLFNSLIMTCSVREEMLQIHEERLRLFKAVVRKFHPSFVVLDGVRDLFYMKFT